MSVGWKIRRSIAVGVLGVVVCAEASGQPLQFTERDVTFRNGAVELHGTFMRPVSPRPAPAIVFLHGSGPHARAGFKPYAEEFARMGVASLFFDKRGSGKSGGSWVTASLQDLAGDALAAVAHLKTEDGIDSSRIGFWGISQAGWVAPLAVARSKDVAFMILISGGGAAPRESELFSYRQQFARAGLSPADSALAEDVLKTYFEYLATGEGRAPLVARLAEIRKGTLRPLADQLERILPSEENRSNWSWVASYDPAPHIQALTCPILLLFGGADADHPTDVAVERWRSGLRKAGNDRASIVVFPGAGHGIRMREAASGGGRAPFADGYAEVQLGWIWQHVVAPAR